MHYDIRKIHEDDILPLFKKIENNISECDIRSENQRTWFLNINLDNIGLPSGEWTFVSTIYMDAQTNEVNRVSFSYLPPNGGHIRFDGFVGFVNHPEFKELQGKIENWLVKYGGMGKNRLSHFENIEL